MFKAGIMLLLRPGYSPAQQFAANKQAKYLPSLISPAFKYLIYTKTVYILRIGNHLGRGYSKVYFCLPFSEQGVKSRKAEDDVDADTRMLGAVTSI